MADLVLQVNHVDVVYDSDSGIFRKKPGFHAVKDVSFSIEQGEIIKIASDGSISGSRFDNRHLLLNQSLLWPYTGSWTLHALPFTEVEEQAQEEYLEDLFDFAEYNGVHREDLQLLLEAGYDVTDLEELIFNPDWLEECLADVLGVPEPEIVFEL